MKVRVLTTLRGPELCANPGSVLEVGDELGQELVAAGAVQAIGPDGDPVEAATEAPTETATQPRPSRGTRGGRAAEG